MVRRVTFSSEVLKFLKISNGHLKQWPAENVRNCGKIFLAVKFLLFLFWNVSFAGMVFENRIFPEVEKTCSFGCSLSF